jgi:hypothetical protein
MRVLSQKVRINPWLLGVPEHVYGVASTPPSVCGGRRSAGIQLDDRCPTVATSGDRIAASVLQRQNFVNGATHEPTSSTRA